MQYLAEVTRLLEVIALGRGGEEGRKEEITTLLRKKCFSRNLLDNPI